MSEGIRKLARPVGFVSQIVTLCVLAIIETIEGLPPPQWFLGFGIVYSSEWLVERAYRKSKGEA